MPYSIIKINNGFKVCKKDNNNKCFSKKPLTKDMATKQMKAIIINENKQELKGSKIIKLENTYPNYTSKRCW